MKKYILTLATIMTVISLNANASNVGYYTLETSKEAAKTVTAKASVDKKKAATKKKVIKKRKHVSVSAAQPRISRSDILRMLVLNSDEIRVITQKSTGEGLELSQYSLAQMLELQKQQGNTVRYDQFSCYDLSSEPSTICMLKIEQKATASQAAGIMSVALRVASQAGAQGAIKMLQIVDNASLQVDSASDEVVPDQSVLMLDQSL